MLLKRRDLIKSLLVACLLTTASLSIAQDQPIKSDDKRVALKGYDPVSYFTDNKPEQGSKEFSSEYDDTIYWFKSVDHKEKFSSNPESFAPQFDGYCAIALSKGKKVEADPLAWSIKNGKLFVFFGAPGVPVFKKEGASVVKSAKKHWSKLKNS
jgi:YHS domain-containing protein